MRKKTSPVGARRNAKNHTAVKATKQVARPPPGKGLGKGGAKRLGRQVKRAIQDQSLAKGSLPTRPGKGLGKAGAKRLGRLLKRAIQNQEPPVRAKGSLPKTPVRLLKHQIKTAAENAPETRKAKPNSPRVLQLIRGVVSQFKQRGGMSMAELKQALAAGGYNVTKTNKQKNVLTQRPVNNETLVQTTRNAAVRLNNKKQTSTTQVRTSSVKSPYSKADLRQRKTASKSFKRVGKLQRQARKTPKPKGKTHKPTAKPKGKTHKPAAKLTGKTHKAAAKSYKPRRKTLEARRKSHKPRRKTLEARRKSHKPRRKTPKARRKSPTQAGKKYRYAINQAARVQKAPKVWRRRPKQNRRR